MTARPILVLSGANGKLHLAPSTGKQGKITRDYTACACTLPEVLWGSLIERQMQFHKAILETLKDEVLEDQMAFTKRGDSHKTIGVPRYSDLLLIGNTAGRWITSGASPVREWWATLIGLRYLALKWILYIYIYTYIAIWCSQHPRGNWFCVLLLFDLIALNCWRWKHKVNRKLNNNAWCW